MFLPACGVTSRTSRTILSRSMFVILLYAREEMSKSELISFHENPIDRSHETLSMFTANMAQPGF